MSEVGAVEVEIDPAWNLGGSMVGLEGGVSIRDSQP
jgi:hypothetical protein